MKIKTLEKDCPEFSVRLRDVTAIRKNIVPKEEDQDESYHLGILAKGFDQVTFFEMKDKKTLEYYYDKIDNYINVQDSREIKETA